MVMSQLTGYTAISVYQVWECRKTVYTHRIRVPQTPIKVTAAGTIEIP